MFKSGRPTADSDDDNDDESLDRISTYHICSKPSLAQVMIAARGTSRYTLTM